MFGMDEKPLTDLIRLNLGLMPLTEVIELEKSATRLMLNTAFSIALVRTSTRHVMTNTTIERSVLPLRTILLSPTWTTVPGRRRRCRCACTTPTVSISWPAPTLFVAEFV